MTENLKPTKSLAFQHQAIGKSSRGFNLKTPWEFHRGEDYIVIYDCEDNIVTKEHQYPSVRDELNYESIVNSVNNAERVQKENKQLNDTLSRTTPAFQKMVEGLRRIAFRVNDDGEKLTAACLGNIARNILNEIGER